MDFTDLGLFVIRIAVGLTMAAHGAQKAFGWFGGPGQDRWRGTVRGLGFEPPELWAATSTAAELVGGLLLAVGLVTPFAAAALIAQTIVIIGRAHLSKGYWNVHGGFEYPLLIWAAVVGLALTGPGLLSVDTIIAFTPEPVVRVASVVVGLLAGAVAYTVPDAAGSGARHR